MAGLLAIGSFGVARGIAGRSGEQLRRPARPVGANRRSRTWRACWRSGALGLHVASQEEVASSCAAPTAPSEPTGISAGRTFVVGNSRPSPAAKLTTAGQTAERISYRTGLVTA